MRTLLQEFDLFFIRQDFYDQHQIDFRNDLILPKLDFYQHPIYSSIHAISSYQTWNINFDYVLVGVENWYESLPQNLQYDLLNEQRRNRNAMMYLDNLVTINFWKRMSTEWQEAMISRFDDEVHLIELPDSISEKFLKYHQQIPTFHGPNCYSAVIYSITENRDIIHEWMFRDTFLLILRRNNFMRVKDSAYRKGDILCFYDTHHVLQHACYLVTDTFAFNKNGQTFNDFWGINPVDQIIAEWPQLYYQVYRKTSATQ